MRGTCKYNCICFLCGQHGHGGYQVHSNGKLKGEFKCPKHRLFLDQLNKLKVQHGMNDQDIRNAFKDYEPPNASTSTNWRKSRSNPAAKGAEQHPVRHSSKVTSGKSWAAHLKEQQAQGKGQTEQHDHSVEEQDKDKQTSPPLPSSECKEKEVKHADSIEDSQLECSPPPGLTAAPLSTLTPSQAIIAAPMKPLESPLRFHSLLTDDSVTASMSFSSPLGLPAGHSLGFSFAALYDNDQAVTVDMPDCDDFLGAHTLRISTSALCLEGNPQRLDCKAQLLTSCTSEEVAVRGWSWPRGATLRNLRSEVKALRLLSHKTRHVARVLHAEPLMLSSSLFDAPPLSPSALPQDMACIVSESSDMGSLDTFFAAFQRGHPEGFSMADLQTITRQLIDGLLACHENRITHRALCPQNILVTQSTDHYQPCLLLQRYVLKYTNLVINVDKAAHVPDKWLAPEVGEGNGNHQQLMPASDIWALGLLLFYLATGGHLPFESQAQARDARSQPDLRKTCLERHGVHTRFPMLYDLIERMLRTPPATRSDLLTARCHPFLWTMDFRQQMLQTFANTTIVRGCDAVTSFLTQLDKICPVYVFTPQGWAAAMYPPLLALVQPLKLKTEYWWSGSYLLIAILNQISFPETLGAIYPMLSPQQALQAYLRQITETDFPRLLVLLYELAGLYGSWHWDGEEVSHTWHPNASN